jgi:hypothetical protein
MTKATAKNSSSEIYLFIMAPVDFESPAFHAAGAWHASGV